MSAQADKLDRQLALAGLDPRRFRGARLELLARQVEAGCGLAIPETLTAQGGDPGPAHYQELSTDGDHTATG